MKTVHYDPFVWITQGTGITGFSHVITYLTNIEGILKNIDNGFLSEFSAVFGLISMFIQPAGNIVNITSGSIHAKDFTDNSGFFGNNNRILIRGLGISEWHFAII